MDFRNALKTNEYLQFAVLSGCMRISKESIFTGINNFNIMSITDVEFDEYFGFTDEEVKNFWKIMNCLTIMNQSKIGMTDIILEM